MKRSPSAVRDWLRERAKRCTF